MQVGETSVVKVDCSRAGPGELSLEAALDSPQGKSGESQYLPARNNLRKDGSSS